VHLAIGSKFSQSLPSALPMLSLPSCANRFCPRPPTLWQRWWARNEGIRLYDDWFCSPECFTAGLSSGLEIELRASVSTQPPKHRLPLGLILLEQGLISHGELQKALCYQRSGGRRRIGEWLVKMELVRPQEVINALAVQQNCPVFRSPAAPAFPDAMRFPVPLIRQYGGVPVYFNAGGNCLYLGFCGPLHRPLLRAAEQLMRCRIEPCIVSGASHRRALQHWETSMRGEAITFAQRQSQREMVRTICGYAEQTGASACSVARCHDYLWTRLYGDLGSLDLLFRVSSEPAADLASSDFETEFALI